VTIGSEARSAVCLGAKTTSVLGGGIAITGLAGMALAITYPSLNWLLYLAYPCATVGGGLNTYGVYGFLWIYPDHQNLLASLGSAVAAASDTLALLAVVLYKQGVSFSQFLLGLACLAAVGAAVCYCMVPGAAEFNFTAAVYLAKQAGLGDSDDARRAVLDEVAAESKRRPSVGNIVRDTLRCFRLHPWSNMLVINFYLWFYLFFFYTAVQMLFFYGAIFNHADAVALVDIFALVFGVAGVAASVGGGLLCDRIGIVAFTGVLVFLNLAYLATLFVWSFHMQVVAQVILTITLGAYITAVTRISMLYAPPDLFGSFSGLQLSVIGLSQLVLSPLLDYLTSTYLTGTQVYMVPYTIFGTASAISGIMVLVFWQTHPPPKAGTVVLPPLDQKMNEAHRSGRSLRTMGGSTQTGRGSSVIQPPPELVIYNSLTVNFDRRRVV
jgi:hypothetical protein